MIQNNIHLAAEPKGLVQYCSRCGRVLQEYKPDVQVQGTDEHHPMWFKGSVEVHGRFSLATDEQPNCISTQGYLSNENANQNPTG